jgi:hypothetical protein
MVYIYLCGLPEFMRVITDNKPLLPLYNSYRADMPPRIHMHKLNLQGYTFNLKHKPGKDNPTDYMSRHPTLAIQIPDPREQMKTATGKDPTMPRLIQAIQTGYINNPDKQQLMLYSHIFNELSTAEGLVLRGSKMVVLESLRNQVVTLSQ